MRLETIKVLIAIHIVLRIAVNVRNRHWIVVRMFAIGFLNVNCYPFTERHWKSVKRLSYIKKYYKIAFISIHSSLSFKWMDRQTDNKTFGMRNTLKNKKETKIWAKEKVWFEIEKWHKRNLTQKYWNLLLSIICQANKVSAKRMSSFLAQDMTFNYCFSMEHSVEAKHWSVACVGLCWAVPTVRPILQSLLDWQSICHFSHKFHFVI